MFDDDLPVKSKSAPQRNLEPLSLAELDAYVVELKGEISRTEAEIARKSAHMNAASSLFKSPPKE